MDVSLANVDNAEYIYISSCKKNISKLIWEQKYEMCHNWIDLVSNPSKFLTVNNSIPLILETFWYSKEETILEVHDMQGWQISWKKAFSVYTNEEIANK